MISPDIYVIPGRWRWRKYFAVITDDFGTVKATAVAHRRDTAFDRCLDNYERNHPC